MIIVLALLIALVPLGVIPAAKASGPTSLAVDGSAAVGCPNTTSSCTATLSTQHGNDIVIAFATESLDVQTSCTFIVSDTASLSWTARSGIAFTPDGRGQLQEFWAKSINPLSSDAVTESISGCGTNYNNLMVFGISGAGFNVPFDTNTALPGSANGNGGNTAVLVSTSNARDMTFSAVLHLNTAAFPAAEPGYTIITPPGTNAVEYEIVNSTLTGSSVTFIDSASGNWVSVGDAVQSGTTDFVLTANPPTLTIATGASGSSTIAATSLNSFSGTVTLGAVVTPPGPALTLSASSLSIPPNGTASSTLTVSTTNTTAAGSYTVTVTGMSGSISHSATIALTIFTNMPSPLAIDGSTGLGCPNTTSSCSSTLTTSHGNDIIIAFATESLDIQTSCVFTISDGNSLSWNTRSGVVFTSDGRGQLQEFSARSINPLSSDIITETIAGCGTNYNNLMAFGVSGANFGSPFDINSALPGTASGNGGNTSVKISTSNPNDMVFAAVLHLNTTAFPTAQPGFTIITPPGTNAVEYERVNSLATNSSVTFLDSAPGNWISIRDAVEAGSTTPDFAITANPNNLNIPAGSTATSTITVTGFNGFSGAVSLTTVGSAGIGAVVNPASINGTGTATLTITTNSTGTFTVQVNGNSGALSRSVTLSITVAGTVCLISTSTTSCPAMTASINGAGQSQLRLSVFTEGSSGLDGFDIILLADHTYLRPTGIDLTGSLLLGTPTILAECLGGVLVRGSACSSRDTLDTLELAAASAVGKPDTPNPTTGLLFTAVYNITGATTGLNLGFQTGCGSSNNPTSDTPYCVDIANGSPTPVLDTLRGAVFSEIQTLTTSFKGVVFHITSSLVNQSSINQLIGTIQVIATNSTTGQTVFSTSYSIVLTYPIASQNPSANVMLRFVLLVSSLRDGILCSTGASSAPLIQCFATYNPDVFSQGQINIVDASALTLAYSSSPGSPHWNPYFDFDLSGSIGITDVSIEFAYFGAPIIA